MSLQYTTNLKAFLNTDGDGTLKIVRWAEDLGTNNDKQIIGIDLNPRSIKMAHSSATGEGLVSNGEIGADVIRVAAGEGFVPHTHPGDHLLIIAGGKGTITYNGNIYPTMAGEIYMIEGKTPHAVGGITDHVIIAIGAPHKPVDSPDRMTPIEYQTVTTEISDLTCLICKKSAQLPNLLHEVGCQHCPCYACLSNDS